MEAVWGNQDRVGKKFHGAPKYDWLRSSAVGAGPNPYQHQQVRFGPGVAAGDENMYFAGLLTPGPVETGEEGLGIWDMGGGGATGMASVCPFGDGGCATTSAPDTTATAERVLPEAALIGAPDVIDRERGGSAFWKHETLWKRGIPHLVKVMVSDEQLWCAQPQMHLCNVFCWFNMTAKDTTIRNINRLTPNVGKDGLTGLVWTRANSLDTCLALAVWVKRGKAINKRGLAAAFDQGLQAQYFPHWRSQAITELISP